MASTKLEIVALTQFFLWQNSCNMLCISNLSDQEIGNETHTKESSRVWREDKSRNSTETKHPDCLRLWHLFLVINIALFSHWQMCVCSCNFVITLLILVITDTAVILAVWSMTICEYSNLLFLFSKSHCDHVNAYHVLEIPVKKQCRVNSIIILFPYSTWRANIFYHVK